MEITIVLSLPVWLWVTWAVLGLVGFGALFSGLHMAGSGVAFAILLALFLFLVASIWLVIVSLIAGLWWAALIAAAPILFCLFRAYVTRER